MISMTEWMRGFHISLKSVRRWLLYFFALTMPMVIFLGNTEYGYTKTIYTFIYISVLVLLWAADLTFSEDGKVKLTALSVPVALLFVSGLLSIVNASSKGVVLQGLALLVYFYLIYFLIVNTIETRSEANKLLYALLASGLGASIYGLLQFIGMARGPYGFRPGPQSIISVMGNQNYLAGYISYLFFPAVILIVLSDSKVVKTFFTTVLGLFFFLLFPIGARGAWLGIVFGLVVTLVGISLTGTWELLTRRKISVAIVILVLIVAYLFASAPGPLNSVLSYSAGNGDESGWGVFTPIVRPIVNRLIKKGGARVEDWHIAMEMFKDHPFLGIGLGNYKINFLDYRAEFLQTEAGGSYGEYIPRGAQAHNEYVQFLAELGLLGAAAIVFAITFSGYVLIRRLAVVKDGEGRLLGTALLAGIVGFLVHSTVSFPAHLPASSLVFVSLLGLLNSAAFGETDIQVKVGKTAKYALAGVLVVLVVTVSVFAYRDWRANVLMGEGKKQLQVGHYRLSRESFLKSESLDFQPRQTYYYLGVVERQLGNDQAALEYFKKSLGQFEPYKLFLQLSTLYLNGRNYERAEYYLNKFLDMGPDRNLRLEATYFLATVKIRQKDLSAAEGLIDKVLDQDPNYERALIVKGDIYRYRGKVIQARETWERALTVIERKLSGVKSDLTGTMPLQRYEELRSRKEVLEKERDAVEEKLSETR